MGGESDDCFCVRGYETLAYGGSLFVRLSSRSQPDLPRALADFDHGHT